MDKTLTQRSVTTSKVESLLKEHRPQDALSEVLKYRSKLTACSDMVFVSTMYHLHARALLELGNYGQALLKIKVALRLMRAVKDDSIFANMKLTLGRILVRLGRFEEASESFNESYVYHKRVGDYESIFFPLNDLAQLHYVTGNLGRCCEVLRLSIKYASKYGEQKNVNIDRRNLAMVQMRMGEIDKALSILESFDLPAISDREAAKVIRQKGIIHLLQLEQDSASGCIDRAFSYFESIQSARDVSICNEYYGLIEYNKGNYTQAREYYQQVLDMPEPTASAVAQTLRMLTDVCIAERNFDEAMATAKKAEKAITKINERIELGALYRAYGQIYTPRKNYKTARDYFDKSIALLREIGARYELALTYFACGESKSYDNKTRMRHLESARFLFDEMGVPKRVAQIQSAIDELKIQSVPDVIISHESSAQTMVAASPEMKRLVSLADKVAKSHLTVLLTGETGVGKDIFARYIHEASGRKGEFVPMNAAALPQEMIESELFGCRVGAFTGAVESRAGLFERAEGGTFYLNEIADATPAFQAKLLEILETHEVRRLGETEKRHVDFRLIAATNSDLEQEVEDGRFRSDLFYRLNEFSLVIPPLSERPDDITELVSCFVRQMSPDISVGGQKKHISALSKVFSRRKWPGNVRELRAEINRLWVECGGDVEKMASSADLSQSLDLKEELIKALEKTRWNRRETARRLGVSDTTVRNWIKRFNLD